MVCSSVTRSLKAKVIARELGLEIGSSRYGFEGDWKSKGLFAYKSGKYAGQAYFGLGGEGSELLGPLDDEESIGLGTIEIPVYPRKYKKDGSLLNHTLLGVII